MYCIIIKNEKGVVIMYLELALYIMSLPIEQQICINSIVFIVAVVLFIINDKLEKRKAGLDATLTRFPHNQKNRPYSCENQF